MEVSKENVLRFLPHRRPFLFIDTVESITIPGKTLRPGETLADRKEIVGCKVLAHYHISEDMDVLAGHFPGNPIVPGVVQIEMMAQASCFVLMKLVPNPYETKLEVALIKVEEAKFRKPIRPGMSLQITSLCQKIRGPMISSQCTITCEGEVMAEAILLASSNF